MSYFTNRGRRKLQENRDRDDLERLFKGRYFSVRASWMLWDVLGVTRMMLMTRRAQVEMVSSSFPTL